jgi:hypothetical protein
MDDNEEERGDKTGLYGEDNHASLSLTEPQ